MEVYVRPFPNVNDARWQISNDGEREPSWSPSGDGIFHKNFRRQRVGVSVSTEGEFEVVGRRTMFTLPVSASYFAEKHGYDIAPDGRFLMLRSGNSEAAETIGDHIVVENFFEELRQRVGK